MAEEVKADAEMVIDLTDEAEKSASRVEPGSQPDSVPRWRKVLAGILAVLAIVAVVSAVHALWVKTTLQDEDQFVSTFASLPQNDAVAAALSVRIVDGIVETQDVQGFITGLLPSELGFVAAPVTDSIAGLLAEGANAFVQSDAVTEVWTTGLRVTHVAVSAVLSGNDRALEAEGGAVAINLDEIAGVVVERVEATGIDLPDGSVELGSVVIYEGGDLGAAQQLAQWITFLGWFMPLIAIALIALAVFASTNRRRMTAILGFGTSIALLLTLASYRVTENALLGDIEDPIRRDAAEAVWDTTLARPIAANWALIVLALIIGTVAWLVGPSERAARMRSRGEGVLAAWQRPAEQQPFGFVAFLSEWKRTIQVVIIVLGLLFVLLGPTPSGVLVIGTSAVVLVLVVMVEVFAGPAPAPAEQLEDLEV